MSRCWEFAEEIPGQSTNAFSAAAADNNVHLIAGRHHVTVYGNMSLSVIVVHYIVFKSLIVISEKFVMF